MSSRKNAYFFQKADDAVKLYVYDEITKGGDFNWETWSYDESETSAKYFRDQLEDAGGKEIELHINSNGGDVMEANSIYSLLCQYDGKITAYVDGMCYSAAVLILMAADERIMAKGSTMLVHNAWTIAIGNANELRKAADDLDALMNANRQVFLERINLSEEELISLMEEERILSPEEAVEMGFATKVIGAVSDASQAAEEQTAAIEERIDQIISRDAKAAQLRELAIQAKKARKVVQKKPEVVEKPKRNILQLMAEAYSRNL